MPKGRPSLTGKSKMYSLRVRLDDDERARVEARAAELGKGISVYARELMLADSPPLTAAAKKPAAKKKPTKLK